MTTKRRSATSGLPTSQRGGRYLVRASVSRSRSAGTLSEAGRKVPLHPAAHRSDEETNPKRPANVRIRRLESGSARVRRGPDFVAPEGPLSAPGTGLTDEEPVGCGAGGVRRVRVVTAAATPPGAGRCRRGGRARLRPRRMRKLPRATASSADSLAEARESFWPGCVMATRMPRWVGPRRATTERGGRLFPLVLAPTPWTVML
jgi:hypothetical protein